MFKNVNGLYDSCEECPYFREPERSDMVGECWYMGAFHTVSKNDEHRCERIREDYENWCEFCESVSNGDTILK